MKRLLGFAATICLMLGLLAQPAVANTDGLLNVQFYPVVPSTGSIYAVSGMSATMFYADQTSLGCDSSHVESMYVIKNYDPNNPIVDGVEFGWAEFRSTCGPVITEMIIEQIHNGAETHVLHFTPCCGGFANYRMSMWLNPADSLYHFFYDAPSPGCSGGRCFLNTTVNPNLYGTWNGRGPGHTSEELSLSTDELGCCHDNVWARNVGSASGWQPVNSSQTVPAQLKKGFNSWCDAIFTLTHNTGSTGDLADYNFRYPSTSC